MGKMKDEAFEKMSSKQKEFYKSFEDFLEKELSDSGATPDEWMELFSNVNKAQDNGLSLGDIKKVITEVLK
jgi:uncharacterized protein related to proFAR isomerase